MSKVIMTVEDSPTMRRMIRFSLERSGYKVVEAEDGEDALKKLENAQVHMLLVDWNMPNMGGLNLVREVRASAEHKFVPIVMLTTETQDSKKVEARAAGATAWMVKPFETEQLISVVKKVLG